MSSTAATNRGRDQPGRIVATLREDRLILLAVASVLALALLYVLAVRTGWGQELDNAALSGRTTRATVLRATDHLLNTISIASLVLVGGTIVLIAFWRGRPHLALTAGVIVGGSCVTTEILKRVVLSRPVLTDSPAFGPSFPSGHTTVAFSLVFALVLVVPARARTTTAVLAFPYAALVGIGVVTAGWHRPSDVIGGELVVTAWSAAAVAVLIAWRGAALTRPPGATTQHVPVVPPLFAGLGLALIAVGFVGFAAAVVAIRQDQLDAVRLNATYAASMFAIVGAGLLLFAALLGALRGVRLDPNDEEEEARGAVGVVAGGAT